MTSEIKDPVCKVCGRRPSYQGNEPMINLPALLDGKSIHVVLCAGCATKRTDEEISGGDLANFWLNSEQIDRWRIDGFRKDR